MKWNEDIKSYLRHVSEAKTTSEMEAHCSKNLAESLRSTLAHIEELEVLEQFTTPDYCLALSNADHEIDALKKRIEELEHEPTLYKGVEKRTCINCQSEYPDFGYSSHMRCWDCRFEAEQLKESSMSDTWAKLISAADRELIRRTEQVKELKERISTLKEKADEMVEVISHAAPTGWAASGDLVGAAEWEKKAAKSMEDYEGERCKC